MNNLMIEGGKAPMELLPKETIKSQQNDIRKSLLKIDAEIHSNAVQCMLHCERTGDTSLFRRLVVEIIDAKTGYRRQGLLAWMKEFSPMRLTKDNINLSGMWGEIRQPFRVEEAARTPFWTMEKAKEMVQFQPIFKDNLTSRIEKAVKDYRAAIQNTLIVPGQPPQPKDPTKPFYDGIHLDKMEKGFDAIEKIAAELLSFSDSTGDVHKARQALKAAELARAAGN